MKGQNKSIQAYKTPFLDIEKYNSQQPLLRKLLSIQSSPKDVVSKAVSIPEIVIVTSYPPRECGIATFSQDLIVSLKKAFSNSFHFKICALESGSAQYEYSNDVKYVLDTSVKNEYLKLAKKINSDVNINTVLIQHEFGFFEKQKSAFFDFVETLSKPVVIAFHTVLPNPADKMKKEISSLISLCRSVIVMTMGSAEILKNDYNVSPEKIAVIAHGTHLVPHLNKKFLKEKYSLTGKTVLSTFGLLSSGKSIETTIEALPQIVKEFPNVVFLVLGKTHPEVVKHEGEKYREMLAQKAESLGVSEHVVFCNKYLMLEELLEYLQLTDVYLFTSNDPHQAVSGTFVYAMSCSCPIISTPIPHAKEVLTNDTGIIIDFNNPQQLKEGVVKLLRNKTLCESMTLSTLQKIVSTAWENSAIEHAFLFKKLINKNVQIKFNYPEIHLQHVKKMTTKTGIIQFSKISQPDLNSGYTLDDNARALIAAGMFYKLTGEMSAIALIEKYLNFIKTCQIKDGSFLNYMDRNLQFTEQNNVVNLDDSNGRAIWALGYIMSLDKILPAKIIAQAKTIFSKSLQSSNDINSPRALAFTIKGIFYFLQSNTSPQKLKILVAMSNKLVQMYKHVANDEWNWFEDSLTYANSVLPESLLYSWILTKDPVYMEIASSSFDFLLSKIFNENGIEVISNKSWMKKGKITEKYGEQPIDVAYTIMTLRKFYEVTREEYYLHKMRIAFSWFLGNNRLHQIIYNPSTGGCYDGLEKTNVNINQGAESTISFLMARMTMEDNCTDEAIASY